MRSPLPSVRIRGIRKSSRRRYQDCLRLKQYMGESHPCIRGFFGTSTQRVAYLRAERVFPSQSLFDRDYAVLNVRQASLACVLTLFATPWQKR